MTIDEYKDLLLEDEINIGYDVEEDDLPEEIEEESYIDSLMTSGFHAVNDSELFGEEIVGYSYINFIFGRLTYLPFILYLNQFTLLNLSLIHI